jgi:hypothetical protein
MLTCHHANTMRTDAALRARFVDGSETRYSGATDSKTFHGGQMNKVSFIVVGLLCTACGSDPEPSPTQEDMRQSVLDASVDADAARPERQPARQPAPQRWSGIQVCQGSSDYADAGYATIKKQTVETQLESFTHTNTKALLKGLKVGSHPEYSCPGAVDVDAMVTGIQVGTDFEADVDKLICTTAKGRQIWLRALSGFEYEGSLKFSASLYSEGTDEERTRRDHQWDLDAAVPVPDELFNLNCNYELELR